MGPPTELPAGSRRHRGMRFPLALVASVAIAVFATLACGGGDGETPLPTSTLVATSAIVPAATLVSPTEEPSAANAIAAVRADLSTRVSEQNARTMPVISITRHDWPDVCFGLTSPGDGFCDQVTTPGYEITMGFPDSSTWIFRTDLHSNSSLATVLPEG